MKKKITNRAAQLSVVTSMPTESSYDKDLYKWTKEQTKFLKKKDFDHIDWANIIEEIESLGKSDKRALKSHFIVLLTHMIKQMIQPEMDCNSWKSSITNSRRQIRFILEDSPSLKNELERIFSLSYELAREQAAEETQIKIGRIPEKCPWTKEELLNN